MKETRNRLQNEQREEPIEASVLMKDYGHVFAQLPGDALKGANTPVNVFGMLLRSPKVAELFIPYWGKSKADLNLSIRQQELIILRTACYYSCDYVWGHHVPVAKEVGVSDEEIGWISNSAEEQGWSDAEQILLLVVDDVLSQANLSDERWLRLREHWSAEQVLDIITVISQYLLFNSVNNIFGLKLENDTMPRLHEVV